MENQIAKKSKSENVKPFQLLNTLGYNTVGLPTEIPKEPQSFANNDDSVRITEALLEEDDKERGYIAVYSVTDGSGTGGWKLKFKVVMATEDVQNIANIAVRFAPAGTVISMQPDSHGAGNVYVGLVMCFDEKKIPINFISGDIGCGLSVIPVVSKKGEHLHLDKTADNTEYHSYILAKMRASLKRGAAAEKGEYMSALIQEAARFYGYDELSAWLDEMRFILDAVGMETKDSTDSRSDIYPGLNEKQSATLRFIGRYAQSLGSSGNHFMELCADDGGAYWIVVHSGSRGLGAAVYSVIADAARLLTGDYEIVSGQLASFYQAAHDALTKFAKLNRMLCALAVLDALGMETSEDVLKKTMCASPLFAPAISQCHSDAAVLALLSGLVHNGIKAYVNHETAEVLYVLSKGSVSMTRRSAAAIVALRAGDGCYVWTLADASCPWIELPVAEAVALGYKPVAETPDVIYSGHGAGRARSTTKTSKMASFADVVAFYEEQGIVGNVAPALLGDHPRIAYNPVEAIIAKLPLHIACSSGKLRTCVAYKEGISHNGFNKYEVEACAKYITEVWDSSDQNRRLWLDFAVSQRFLDKDAVARMTKEREEYMTLLDAKWGGCLPAHLRNLATP